MAMVITYEIKWVCDTCSAEMDADAECITHEESNEGHDNYTQAVRIILVEE